jgi:hypothetical protein
MNIIMINKKVLRKSETEKKRAKSDLYLSTRMYKNEKVFDRNVVKTKNTFHIPENKNMKCSTNSYNTVMRCDIVTKFENIILSNSSVNGDNLYLLWKFES